MNLNFDRITLHVSTTLTGLYVPETNTDPAKPIFESIPHATNIYDDYMNSECLSTTSVHQVNVLASYCEEDNEGTNGADIIDIGTLSALLVEPAQVDYDIDTVSEELAMMVDINASDPDEQKRITRLISSKEPFLLITDLDLNVELDTRAQLLTLFVEMACIVDKFSVRNFGHVIDMYLYSNAWKNFDYISKSIRS